ncbi:hypothetical protein [Aequorivita marina]|uniref:hypothetical protein n=1 Tax=Aequorivita marina TaxID=3073654 RepID=UPI002873F531|nr:hypothetical protein [Aequorivita sp. S2608]MDS1298229.1 hypothetical protein [Aequorivita sp. S2608]
MKDVGKIFESKLKKGEKKPKESVWEKLNTSLDAKEARKKRTLYAWLVAAGLVCTMVFLLIYNTQTPLEKDGHKQNNNTPKTNLIPVVTESASKKSEAAIDTMESSKIINEASERPTGNEILTDSKKYNEKAANSKSKPSFQSESSEDKSEARTTKENIETDSFIVSTTYYYYDSQSGKTITTTEKSKIDSLIAEQPKKIDTLSSSKTDSTNP